jgi:hypothetical protein
MQFQYLIDFRIHFIMAASPTNRDECTMFFNISTENDSLNKFLSFVSMSVRIV